MLCCISERPVLYSRIRKALTGSEDDVGSGMHIPRVMVWPQVACVLYPPMCLHSGTMRMPHPALEASRLMEKSGIKSLSVRTLGTPDYPEITYTTSLLPANGEPVLRLVRHNVRRGVAFASCGRLRPLSRSPPHAQSRRQRCSRSTFPRPTPRALRRASRQSPRAAHVPAGRESTGFQARSSGRKCEYVST